MSDLQCPARLFLLGGSSPPAPSVVAALRGQRVVAVYGPEPGSDSESEVASRLADELGTAVATTDSLDDVADRHRGEAVVVVGDHGYDEPLVAVEIDADGMRVTSPPAMLDT